ncbi:TonB-dependent hemoglobin/transferrin/lactoferrin family receptor [Agrobacterium tumefaciens]|uniref:TonB-dependent hemoglobin/transferrin/lactoferrin family receptor n=1 Tax=Agrobacterium tumefaciens TaxID=358 RepID=A0AAP9J7L9_AGRTU|nr:TonB-dependent receptor [Agrobacterium tumefaciens]NSY02979.1 TonB-dependent hemoglobin/transferrin/lactoferrin family receptor [Agrobacterium tumefaciens]NSZ59452.1 TonB-dependent hemoglobin/transferrin/lactoferrin family receptor [Agrobacterium tumefaciens]OVE88943.1 TonB-dependent heme/hemoglobin receptor family protein [Agrobacterium tumefaciens]QDY95915.1 TonB-dependent hemoglobin/transferrin/lactoferrin family receptor [Agrobacterium tumefaciens]UXS46155.1 TonB-dependent hemoglobin/tr
MRLQTCKTGSEEKAAKQARRGVLLATTAIAVSFAAPIFAQTGTDTANSQRPGGEQGATRPFNIPAQSLSSVVGAFGRQSGLQVTLATPSAGNVRTNAVTGSFTVRDALSRLLAGTGVNFRITGNGRTVIIGTGQSTVDLSGTEGTTVLETITVTGKTGRNSIAGSGYQGTPDWVYETPASVSVVGREAIQSAGVRNTRDVFNRVSGVYAGEGNGSFPTVSPNVRGLQESGRVVVSIDGARQNAQRGAAFGGATSYTASAGQGYVDVAFIRAVEIEKITNARSGNAGSLGGKVEFRTVSADDLIAAGENKGGEVNVSRGTNGYDFQGSVLGAVRSPDGPLSFVAGYSRTIMDEYKIGTKGEARSTALTMKDLLGRDGWSTFFKGEGDFGDVKASLSWMHQENDFVQGASTVIDRESVRNDSVVAKLDWDPESELIDFKSSLWLNDNMTHELRAARNKLDGSAGYASETNLDMGLRSFGGSLENTSRFDTVAGALSLNYGAEAFRDIATSVATSATIVQNPAYASSYTAFSPAGRRDVASLFLNGELEPADWITLSGGVRYDWSRLKGSATYYSTRSYLIDTSVACDPVRNHYTALDYFNRVFLPANPSWATRYALYLARAWPNASAGCMPGTGTTTPPIPVTEYPEHNVDIDRTYSDWLPSATIELKPVDWFRPYVSYSQSLRPPTILEAFFAGARPGDSAGYEYAPNQALRAEKATTYEIGANISFDGVLLDDDSIRIKMAAFRREVKDYIALGYLVTDQVLDRTYTSFVNLDGTTYMRGLEFEGNYDARSFWIGGSATFLKTEWPEKTQVFSNSTTTTTGEIVAWPGDVAPKVKLTLDGGMRFFDEKFSLGARLNHVTPTQSRTLDTEGNLREVTDPYTTVDLYGSYAFNDKATLRFAVNNLTDRKYIPAASAYTAPGRTFIATMNVKF